MSQRWVGLDAERPPDASNHTVFVSELLAQNMFYPFQRGDRLYTSEPDVCGRQVLTYKDGPRAENIERFIMIIDS